MPKTNYFYFAKNKEGLKDFETMNFIYSKNIGCIELSEEDTLNLWDFGSALNQKFDKLIDLYEDETLEPELLPETLKTALEFKNKAADPKVKEAFGKAIEAINLAIKYNSPLVFWW